MGELTKQHQAVIDRILDLYNKGKINAEERDRRIRMIVGRKKGAG